MRQVTPQLNSKMKDQFVVSRMEMLHHSGLTRPAEMHTHQFISGCSKHAALHIRSAVTKGHHFVFKELSDTLWQNTQGESLSSCEDCSSGGEKKATGPQSSNMCTPTQIVGLDKYDMHATARSMNGGLQVSGTPTAENPLQILVRNNSTKCI